MLKFNWEKVQLFIMSLWLLFFLVIIINVDIPICFGSKCEFMGWYNLVIQNIVTICALFFLLIGIISYFRFKYKTEGSRQNTIKVLKIKNKDYEHLTFLSTYIIPLIAFDLSKIRYVIILIILLTAIGTMYIKTNMFYSNPSLALLGYKLYKINGKFRTKQEEDIIIISKEPVRLGDSLSFKKIEDKVYYVRVLK